MKRLAIMPVILLLAGCSSHPDPKSLVETVSADCDIVLRTDLNRLLKTGGAGSHGGVLDLTPDMEKLVPHRPSFMLIERVVPLGAHVDLDTVVICAARGRYYLTAWMRHGESLPMPKSDDGHEAYYTDSLSAWVDGRQVWFSLPGVDIVDDVAAAHAEESEKSAAEVPVFGSGCIIEGFVNSGIDRNNAVEAFSKIGFAVNIFDRVVTGQLSFIDADNNPVSPFGNMADISSLPRLLPSLGNISLTMGVTPEVKQFVTSQLTKRIGMKSGLGVSLVADLLGDIDGDFFVTAVPGGSAAPMQLFSADTWQYTSLFPASPSFRRSSLRAVASRFGADVHMTPDSIVLVSNEGGDPDEILERVVYEDVDEGTKAIIRAEVPYNSSMQRALRLSHGFDAELCVTSGEVLFSLSMRGGNGYILPWILETVASI